MFKPSTSTITNEPVSELEVEGWAFDDSEKQYIRGSALRLLPLTGAQLPTDIAWPKISWDQEDELVSFIGDIEEHWNVSFNNQPVVSPQTFEFEPASGYLDIATNSGEYQFLSQDEIGYSWYDEVDNATGWTIQFRMQVITDNTGESLAGHFLTIDDGEHREVLYFHETGIAFANNPDLNIYTDLRSKPREIRIAGKQDDIYVLLDDGLGVAGVDGFTGESASPELTFGADGIVEESRTLWDYLHQYYHGLVIDKSGIINKTYSTDFTASYSPSYQPRRPVEEWGAAFFETSGDLVGGTTKIETQYWSDAYADWQTFNVKTVDVIGTFEILLDNIPTTEDYSDAVRFKISQKSADGSAEAPRIENIKVVAVFAGAALNIFPSWGHRSGGNTVALEIIKDGATFFGSPDQTGVIATALTGDTDVSTVHDTDLPLGDWTASFDETPYGSLMSGWSYDLSAAPATLGLASRVFGIPDGYVVDPYTGQYVAASTAGDGIRFANCTGTGIDFYLEIHQGSVSIAHGSALHTFVQDDYWTPRYIALSLTGSADLSIVAAEDSSFWTIGNFNSYYVAPSAAQPLFSYTSDTSDPFAASITATIHEFPNTGEALISTSSWEFGILPGGFPYVRANDGTISDALTGEWPIRVNVETDFAWSYGDYPDHTGLQILINGEVCGDKITSLTKIQSGSVSAPGLIASTLIDARLYDIHLEARDFARANGFCIPFFEVDTFVPPTDNNLVLHFWESSGPIVDISGREHHLRAALKGRQDLHRDVRIYDEYATAFWGARAIYKILHTSDFLQTLPQGVFAQGFFYNNVVDSTLYKKQNLAGTVGTLVEILTTGQLRVTCSDGTNTISGTTDVVLADGAFRSVGLSVQADSVTVWIDDTEQIFTGTLGSMSAATQDGQLGPNLTAYLRQFALRSVSWDRDTFDSWRDLSIVKWQPEETVYIGGEAVEASNVRHFSPWRKYVVMPPGDPGYDSVYVNSYGIGLAATKPYKYTYGYTRVIPSDRIDKAVSTTHSPFKILSSVPEGSINLAFVQGPEISVERNLSHIDLSYLEAENLSIYGGGEFLLTGQQLTGELCYYTGQVDTEDLLVSNRSAGYRDLVDAVPLYNKYLIGRGRYYIYQSEAVDETDIALIRQGISVIDKDGKVLSIDDFPWDIEVSLLDREGNRLPANVFAVMLFTKLAFIPDNITQVRYTAVDSFHSWAIAPNFLEIINTSEIFIRNDEDLSVEEFETSIRDDGSYDIVIKTE